MRRMLSAGLVALALVVGAGCQPVEPSMKITARQVTPACLNHAIEGTVDPAPATSSVVLQRTVGGKWQDWKWYGADGDGPAHTLTAKPSLFDGGFNIGYSTRTPAGVKLSGIVHFRVRSSGGGYVSNDFYVKFPKVC